MEWRRFEGEEKPLEPFQLETPSLGSDRASRSRALTPAAFTPAAVHAESWEPYSSLLVGRSISAAIEAEVAEIDALTVEEVEEQVRGKHLTNAQTHPLVVDSPVFLDLSELADEISDAKAQALTEAEAAARAKLSKEEAEINAAIAAVDAAVAREDAEAAAAVCAVEAHLARGGGEGVASPLPKVKTPPPKKSWRRENASSKQASRNTVTHDTSSKMAPALPRATPGRCRGLWPPEAFTPARRACLRFVRNNRNDQTPATPAARVPVVGELAALGARSSSLPPFEPPSEPPADHMPSDKPPSDKPPPGKAPLDKPPSDKPPSDKPPSDKPPSLKPPSEDADAPRISPQPNPPTSDPSAAHHTPSTPPSSRAPEGSVTNFAAGRVIRIVRARRSQQPKYVVQLLQPLRDDQNAPLVRTLIAPRRALYWGGGTWGGRTEGGGGTEASRPRIGCAVRVAFPPEPSVSAVEAALADVLATDPSAHLPLPLPRPPSWRWFYGHVLRVRLGGLLDVRYDNGDVSTKLLPFDVRPCAHDPSEPSPRADSDPGDLQTAEGATNGPAGQVCQVRLGSAGQVCQVCLPSCEALAAGAVVWATPFGMPSWPALVLSDEAAAVQCPALLLRRGLADALEDTPGENRPMPVRFFGTHGFALVNRSCLGPFDADEPPMRRANKKRKKGGSLYDQTPRWEGYLQAVREAQQAVEADAIAQHGNYRAV